MDINARLASAIATNGYGMAREAAGTTQEAGGASRLADAGAAFLSTLQTGEDAARRALAGGGDPHTLVQALANSQLAVETAVTLRDKVVEAYQEILRMPV